MHVYHVYPQQGDKCDIWNINKVNKNAMNIC